jgi:hypothetical protein
MSSVLNYLAWELAYLNGEPHRQTAFPIYLAPERYAERHRASHPRVGRPTPRRGLYKVEAIGLEAQEVIHSLQLFMDRYGLSIGVAPTAW